MEHNINMFGEYGENNILEDLVSGNDVTNNYIANEPGPGFDGGFDILQQSLKAADILGTEDTTDSPFDDLGLTFNGDSLSSSSTNKYPLKTENEHVDHLFDTSQFFNVPKPSPQPSAPQQNNNNGTATAQHETSVYQIHADKRQSDQHVFANSGFIQGAQQAANGGKPQLSTTTSSVLIPGAQRTASPSLHAPMIQRTASPGLQTSGINRTASPVLQIVSAPNSAFPQQGLTAIQRTASPSPNPPVVVPPKQYNVFKIQISPNAESLQSSKSYMVQTPQSSQQASAGSQTLAYKSGNTFNTVHVVKSVTPTVVSAPVVLSVAKPQGGFQSTNVQQPTSLSQNNAAVTAAASLQNNLPTNSLTLPSNLSALNQEEQTNKLALLLQNKASQQSGAGKPAILKVGNQSINISNPKVAKALAANILQQHMRQQSGTQQPQQQVINVAKSSNPAFINLSNMQMNSQATIVGQPQVKAQYVITSMAQSAQAASSGLQPQLQLNNTTTMPQNNVSAISTANNPAQYVQLAVSRSQVPINRIQIASVNIPISISTTKPAESVQLASSSIATQSVRNASTANGVPRDSTGGGTADKNHSTEAKATIVSREQMQKVWDQQNRNFPNTSNGSVLQSNASLNVAKPTALAKPSEMQQKSAMSYVTFQVDPNLTYQQVEQVQQIISQKISLSKIPTLSKEQKQLLAAFRAQLRTMETPVQQYYLRNPQLFLQKVYQQLQLGKPFVMHMRVDKSRATNTQPVTTSASGGVVSQLVKDEHPTISLTNNSPRANSPAPRIKRSATPTLSTQVKPPKRQATDITAVIQPSPSMSPVKRPSLIMEQLQKHREIVCNPDVDAPFKSIRDAIRRLLPYHICNTPEVKEKDFKDSEALYGVISERLLLKMNAMIAKYHQLTNKESTRSECSADVVMLQRTFLQNERAALLEVKQRISQNPSAIREYIQEDQADDALKTYFNAEDAKKLLRADKSHDTNQSAIAATDRLPVEAEKDVLLQEAVQSIL